MLTFTSHMTGGVGDKHIL